MKDTNYDYLKTLSLDDMARQLCDICSVYIKVKDPEKEDSCDYCPMTDRCGQGCNGWRDWLMDEWKKGGN